MSFNRRYRPPKRVGIHVRESDCGYYLVKDGEMLLFASKDRGLSEREAELYRDRRQAGVR